jgi:hypothetical protein
MNFLLIIFIILFLFLGYILGRFGHYYLNDWMKNPAWAPHHWLYGLVLVCIGIFYRYDYLGIGMISFGVGLFISDLKDFLEGRLIGADEEGEKRFWGID